EERRAAQVRLEAELQRRREESEERRARRREESEERRREWRRQQEAISRRQEEWAEDVSRRMEEMRDYVSRWAREDRERRTQRRDWNDERRPQRRDWDDDRRPQRRDAASHGGWSRDSRSWTDDRARSSGDGPGRSSGDGRGRRSGGKGGARGSRDYVGREWDMPMHEPIDPKRGGAVTKVAVMLLCFKEHGLCAELAELADRFQEELDARTEAVRRNSWAEKLGRLCVAVDQEDEREMCELYDEFKSAPQLRDAMNNRSWQAWRQRDNA
ncbi:unnamed protein product, partial [Symbiodinium microadriaticum]